MDYHISPAGSTDNDGLSADKPWPFYRLKESFTPQPGDTIRLHAGTYRGGLEWFGVGAPDKPISLIALGPVRIVCEGQRGLWYAGPGGLKVSGIEFVGSGDGRDYAAIEINSDLDGSVCRNVVIEGVRATGFSRAAVVISATSLIQDILVRDCVLSGNAVGMLVSGANGGDNLIRNLRLVDVFADDNTLFNEELCGNGLELVGVEDLEVVGCSARGNGRDDGQGHSGITVQQCRRFRVAHCRGGDTAAGPDGDGQFIVSNTSEDGLIECNEASGGHIGISVHDDRDLFGPAHRSRRIVVRNNLIRSPVVGLQAYRTYGDVWLIDNDVTVHAARGEYRKCVDAYGPHDGPVYVQRNTLRTSADEGGTALLLEAAEAQGLRNVWFGDNSWQGESFKVRGQEYSTLAAALAASV